MSPARDLPVLDTPESSLYNAALCHGRPVQAGPAPR